MYVGEVSVVNNNDITIQKSSVFSGLFHKIDKTDQGKLYIAYNHTNDRKFLDLGLNKNQIYTIYKTLDQDAPTYLEISLSAQAEIEFTDPEKAKHTLKPTLNSRRGGYLTARLHIEKNSQDATAAKNYKLLHKAYTACFNDLNQQPKNTKKISDGSHNTENKFNEKLQELEQRQQSLHQALALYFKISDYVISTWNLCMNSVKTMITRTKSIY
jgi:uncharacterized protein YceH (UPF0502 family)